MDEAGLADALGQLVPTELAADLARDFVQMRTDVATGALGHSAPGKFVETVVQSLQALEDNGTYDSRPNVEGYLKGLESRTSVLPDGLRICCSRLARAMYSLRSKRNIIHKATIDPAAYDLRLLYACAQWVLSEILALADGLDPECAAGLVAEIQLPVGELVEAIDGRFIVQADMTVADELLTVLAQTYPEAASLSEVARSMDRRSPGSVRKEAARLWRQKLVHRDDAHRYVLTQRGLRRAIDGAVPHVG